MGPDLPPLEPPPTCGLALKEWAGVCAALLSGRQKILLRKGGVDDSPNSTWLKSPIFWLYPTHFHEPLHGLRPGVEVEPLTPAPPGHVDLPALALVESIDAIARETDLDALRDSHVLSDEAVLMRFRYRRPGLMVLGLRVLVDEPRRIVERPEYAGCKSWVDLDPPLACGTMRPVLHHDEPPPTHLIRRGGSPAW